MASTTPGPARLTWKDDAGSGYIQVDVIPQLQNTLSSTVTEFPLENGSIVGEHIIHHPDLLTLEIAQTQTPFEDRDDAGEAIEFIKTSFPLDLPKTRFRPKGLLFLSLAAEGAIGAAVQDIGGSLGLSEGTPALAIEVFRPPYEGKDRINELFDRLAEARLRGAALALDWLGRRWTNYYIEQIVYTRKKGRQAGEFSVALKQVQTVSTATGTLPTPAEARLKAGLNGGNRPAKKTAPAEKEVAAKSANESLGHILKTEILAAFRGGA
jgi:hypothetical protein